jgi:hypothetical protein
VPAAGGFDDAIVREVGLVGVVACAADEDLRAVAAAQRVVAVGAGDGQFVELAAVRAEALAVDQGFAGRPVLRVPREQRSAVGQRDDRDELLVAGVVAVDPELPADQLSVGGEALAVNIPVVLVRLAEVVVAR